VDSVVLPGAEGEMGVLPAHSNLVTTLKHGELVYSKGGKSTHFAVGEGLVEVTGTTTRVLTDMAVGVEDIDEKVVQEALDRAKHALENIKPGSDNEEVAAVMAMIQRSTAQLHVKRKRHTL
jgi:F-type H+-transporting ATPase subunit epsilon